MTETCKKCPVCSASQFTPIEQFIDGDFSTWYVSCDGCGLVLMSPRPTPAELDCYYEGEYWKMRAGDNHSRMQKQDRQARYLVSYLEESLTSSSGRMRDFSSRSKILEVGSSFGRTLLQIGERIRELGGGPRLFGIEPSEYAVDSGAEAYRMIKVIGKSWESLASNQESDFDIIVLSHVLEHLNDPVEAIRVIGSALAKDGVLIIEVPNFYGHPSIEYAHNYCFTEGTLVQTVVKAGMRVVRLDVNGHDEDFPFYLTSLVMQGPPGESPEREPYSGILDRRQAAKRAFQELRAKTPRPS